MAHTIRLGASALTAILAMNSGAMAAEPTRGEPSANTTMTLGGKGTAAQAAAADNELTWCHRPRGFVVGSVGFGGGFVTSPGWGWNTWSNPGWNSWGNPGWNTWSSPVWNTWRNPGWNSWNGWNTWGVSSFRSPVVVSNFRTFVPSPSVTFFRGSFNSFGGGFYWGISGTREDAMAPVITLGQRGANNPLLNREPAPAEAVQPIPLAPYDGGPANPVPLPKPDANPSGFTAPATNSVPVSLPRAKPANKPYTFKAYGEK